MLPEKNYRSFRAHAFLLFFFCICFPLVSYAQTEIGGVVNTYSRVLSADDCRNILRVENPGAFAVGQTVLLIGMQGAEMSIDDDETFGQVSTEGLTAGLYDWTSVQNIQGNEVTLRNPASAAYDFSQVVQLVGVPTYTDARVVSELFPAPWDGNVGGVLALEVLGSLELTAGISASELGFRGGQSVQADDDNCTLLTTANNYYYGIGNWRGAPKGEGIVPPVNGREHGRGAQANGGGGSNTHNAGGGGGSNRSAGGMGGQNLEPSFGGCKGFFPGLGGRPLDLGADRWLMGGGGGAGHRNNNSMSSGGNGGGIIVIKAATLFFNGGEIAADGQDGLPAAGDGAGGGGAGGTIVLDVENISGTPLIHARGGRGGDVTNVADRCMGPGGGGSGGQLYSTQTVDADLSGGGTGFSMESEVCPNGPNGALEGAAGSQETGGIKVAQDSPVLNIASTPADTSICPGDPFGLSVRVDSIDAPLNYQWLIGEAGSWVPVVDGPAFSGASTSTLQVSSLGEDAIFQLMISAECRGTTQTDTIRVSVATDGDPSANFSYELDGFTASFNDLSVGAAAYEWTIDEIPFYSSSEAEPEFTFPAYGVYRVNLKVTNSCGVDSSAQTITVGGAPIADFYGESSGSRCVPLTVQWADESEGIFETYQWSFPGGTPSTSVEPNPVVVYDKPGEYDVSLTVTGPLGSNTKVQEGIIKVFSVPQPAFSYMINGLTVSFSSTADEEMTHIWTFGDGNTIREKDPEYTFPAPGAYDVTLNLQNGGCASSITQTILVFTTDVDHHQLEPYVKIWPNPSSGPLQLEGNHPDLFPLDLYVFDLQGQLLKQATFDRSGRLDLSEYSSGPYIILMHSYLGTGSWRILKY